MFMAVRSDEYRPRRTLVPIGSRRREAAKRSGGQGMGSWRGRLLTVAALVGALTLVAAPAYADGERATSYVVDGALRADGTLTVSETISFDGAAPATLTQRLANFRDEANDVRYTYTIRDVKASAGSKDLGPRVTTEDGYTVISVPTASV